jgi:hypothetical protein
VSAAGVFGRLSAWSGDSIVERKGRKAYGSDAQSICEETKLIAANLCSTAILIHTCEAP